MRNLMTAAVRITVWLAGCIWINILSRLYLIIFYRPDVLRVTQQAAVDTVAHRIASHSPL